MGAGAVAGGYDWKGSAFASSGALSESIVGDGIVGVLAESVDVTATEGQGEAEAISAAAATGKAIIHKKKHDKPDDNPSHDDGDDDWKDDDWHHDDHKDDDCYDCKGKYRGDRRKLFEHHDKEIVTTARAISGSSSYSSGHEAFTTAGTDTDVSGHAGAAVAGAGAVAGGYDWKGSSFASSGALSESIVGDGVVGV